MNLTPGLIGVSCAQSGAHVADQKKTAQPRANHLPIISLPARYTARGFCF